jgi:Rieske 2Fe-2S family protein
VFVNALGTADPFSEYVGGMADLVAPYKPETLVLKARHRYDVRANWKILVENYHECYHCPLIHPELCRVSPPTSGDNWDLPGAWVGGLMDLRPDAETMSLDGSSGGINLDGVNPRTVSYLGLFPNLLVSLHPDYVMTHRLEPKAPDLTAIECAWYFLPGVGDPSYAVDFWDVTNREDFVRVGATWCGVATLPAGTTGAGRGRGVPVGDDGRPRLPRQEPDTVSGISPRRGRTSWCARC